MHSTQFSVYSDSEFKYSTRRVTEDFAGFNRHIGVLHRGVGDCDCAPCSVRGSHYSNSIYSFFSERRREHYEDLNSVFVWFDNLHIDFFDEENPRYILEKVHVGMGKDSMFYDDAVKHMSKQFKQNLENFEKSLSSSNSYIQTANVTVKNRINEIINRPVYVKLTDEQESSIYRIVRLGFSQAIKGEGDVSTAIKNWDLSAKLRSHGFNTQREVDNGSNILGAIQQDQNIVEHAVQVQKNIVRLKNQQEILKGQSKEISTQIARHRTLPKRRCCPSLFKEIWHAF